MLKFILNPFTKLYRLFSIIHTYLIVTFSLQNCSLQIGGKYT